MPNRIIKESICTSENLAGLSAEAERLFYRLMVQCDDYGLMFANPNVIRSRCFQLTSDSIKEKNMIAWLSELEAAGLIFFYEVDGKRYLKYTKWERHQQRRANNPKYPLPERGSAFSISSDINGNHLIANVPESSIREANTRVEIESSRDTRKASRTTFVRPTLEEISAYCVERGNTVNPQKFFDHYTANGWRVGKTAMQDWKASVRTWENTERRNGNANTHGSNAGSSGASPQQAAWDLSKIVVQPGSEPAVNEDEIKF